MEMTLVMLVMALIVGLGAYSFGGVSGEELLRRPASEFQKMVLESVRRASLYERAQVIFFDRQGFVLRYQEDQQALNREGEDQLWQRRVEVPLEMGVKLRRWGQNQFLAAAGQKLVIAPGGLCEPLTVRFEHRGSWLELTLDPLSGGVADEAMFVAEDGT